MKIFQLLGFALATYLFSATWLSSFAKADIVHGSICNSMDHQYSKNLLKNSEGVQNISRKPIKVICPLTAKHEGGLSTAPQLVTNAGVLVDYRTKINGSKLMTCTLYSYDFNGNFAGSYTSTSGLNDYITLGGVPVSIWTNHSVVCTLQPLDRIIGFESGI